MLPSSIASMRRRIPSVTPGALTLQSGVQGIKGTSGLNYILNTSSPGVDDSSYLMTIPFTFNMFGTNYGNNNNSVYISTNSFFAFGFNPGGTITLSAAQGRSLAFLNADRRAIQIGTITDPLVNGVTPFRMYWRGTSFSNTSDVFIIEIIFYSNNYVQINYGTMKSSISGQQVISNGGTFVNSWSVLYNTSSSVALSSNATGSNWTVQNGYWA